MRQWQWAIGVMLAWITLQIAAVVGQAASPNILLITVDDMNRDSVGVYGCKVPGVTPNIDRLASEGMRFEHGHVTVAICQPTRAVWMTGRYPHHSGALGFDRIRPDVPVLTESLRKAGYLNGLMAKTGHVIPSRRATFDVVVEARDLSNGRSPEKYGVHAKAFFEKARKEGRPFFLMANSQDPHRPFAGSAQEAAKKKGDAKSRDDQYGGGFPEVTDPYRPDQIPVPGFLPDLPDIRQELSEYYTSVRRADATVGALLHELDAAGFRDSTIVMFLSDHGMPLPFAKTNCWMHSTKTPWIVRWPGVVQAGAVDDGHVVGGVDLALTLLDAVGASPLSGADGRSFVPILRGEKQDHRDRAFTHINTIASKKSYVMRAVNDRHYGYIWSGWSNGKLAFKNESQSGLTFKAMQRAAMDDPDVAARVQHFVYRTPEEFYDDVQDPDALKNRIQDPAVAAQVNEARRQLLTHMESTGDPQLETYRAFLKTIIP